MTSEREDFTLSGPTHLTSIDWNDVDHRRSVAASLVQGVYILERDRQGKREGPKALAPPWWDTFNFLLIHQLVDDVDQSIFGAIYELKPAASDCNDLTVEGTPSYVIAFRGNITKEESFPRDLELNVYLIYNELHLTSRFEIGIKAVTDTAATLGNSNIWIVGHSLGAAIAMLVGKTMAKKGIFLEAFLFNPPFLSAPIEQIRWEKLRDVIHKAGSFMTAGFVRAVKGKQRTSCSGDPDPFVALSSWTPHLYIHPDDTICCGYKGYFERRGKMEDIGMGHIERLATKHSFLGIAKSLIGKKSEEDLHLIPSANLNVNLTRSKSFKRAHGIHQWWGADLQLKSTHYDYK